MAGHGRAVPVRHLQQPRYDALLRRATCIPNTPTLSFHGSTFTSQYLAFTGVETTTNEQVNGQYAPLDTPTAEDQKTFDTYNAPPYVKTGGSIPFIDLGGKFVSSGATYSPEILAGKTQAEVADALKDPSNPIAKAVIGSANVLHRRDLQDDQQSAGQRLLDARPSPRPRASSGAAER